MKREVARLKRKAKKISLSIKLNAMTDNDIAMYVRQTSDGFLFTPEWKALRLKAFEKYGLVCLCCGADNSRKSPMNVDHVKPRKYFPELALDIENLQPLCARCNERKGNETIDYRNK